MSPPRDDPFVEERLDMEIKINIEDIDYEALADLMMPMLIEHMSNDRDDVVSRLMLLSQGFTEATVKKILARMSQQKKDELLIKLISKNKPKIKEFLMKAAAEQGISLSVTDVEVKL